MTNDPGSAVTPLHCRATAFACLGAALALPAFAQTTVPKPADEVVSLSEFTVSADAQTGYTASESITGSRLPTKVKDLPFNIEVITSDFMDDFALLDFSYVFQGGMVTQDQDAGSGYTIRGISSSGQLYNGFWQPAGTPVPSALRSRTEILDGPSAGVYGQTSPGGMVNIVAKQPRRTAGASLRFQAGSYGSFDSRVESTGPLSAKTSYLAIVDYNERGFSQTWHRNRNRTEAFSLARKFDDSSTLTVQLVASNQRNQTPANRVPYLFNSKTSIYYGVAYNLENVPLTGPDSYKNNDNYSVFATYEKRLSNVFSLRVGGDAYSVNSRSFNTTDVTSYDPDPTHAGTNLYTTPFYGVTRLRSVSSSYSAPGYQDNNTAGGGFQSDVVAHGHALDGKLENRALLTLDYNSFYQYILKVGMNQSVKTGTNGLPTLSSTGAPSVNNAADPALIPAAPRFAGDTNYWVPVFNPLGPSVYPDPTTGLPVNVYNLPAPGSGLYSVKSFQKTRRDVFGVMLRDQATLWKRVLLFGTVRFDNVMYNIFTKQYPNFSLGTYPTLANYVAQNYTGDGGSHPGYQGSVAHYHSKAFTGSTGLNYRLTPGLSLYSNYSTSFVPSTQVVTGATTGSYVLPNEQAKGGDYGFKGSLLQDRLTFTAGGFYIYQYNISVTANDANGLAIKQAVGNAVSKGFELTANYFVTNNWSVNTGWYSVDSRWTNTGNDLDQSGRHRAGVPPDIVTLATKYSFTGALKGFSTNWLLQYTGKLRPEDRGNTAASGSNITPVGSNNGLRELILPSATIIGMGVAYDFKSRAFDRTLRHHLQLNVNNLADRSYVTISRGVGDTRTYTFSYQLSF
jgi:outer membrane receptor protein involved in Fe transport